MKRSLLLTVVLLMILLVAAVTVQAGETVIIRPYRLADGQVVTVSTEDQVIITARWVACNRGLTEAFRHSAVITLDETFASQMTSLVAPPGQDYWAKVAPYTLAQPEVCVMQAKSGWATYWNYDLGDLEPGWHELHFTWTLAEPLPDGGDYDGDGEPDIFSSENWGHDNHFVLEVVAP